MFTTFGDIMMLPRFNFDGLIEPGISNLVLSPDELAEVQRDYGEPGHGGGGGRGGVIDIWHAGLGSMSNPPHRSPVGNVFIPYMDIGGVRYNPNNNS